MYEFFSDEARKAIQAANRIATEQGHEFIASEYIFLGPLEQRGTLAQACESLGVAPHRVDQALRERLGAISRGPVPRAKAVIERAIQQAKDLGHPAICIHHVALALVVESEGTIVAALESVGILPQKLQAEILRLNPPCDSSRATFSVLTFQRLLDRFKDHPDILSLREEYDRIQRDKEDAIARQDFKTAARYRDQSEGVVTRLIPILRRLNGESNNHPSEAHELCSVYAAFA
jgi:ATP-dependent Clp protease ATP-binding subunit ClpA